MIKTLLLAFLACLDRSTTKMIVHLTSDKRSCKAWRTFGITRMHENFKII
jgi:hypothetical protein